MLQSADVKKVYDIFIDDSVELAVRKSACEQLAVIIAGESLFDSVAVCRDRLRLSA